MPACPEQPIVDDPTLPSVGGPFYDCGQAAEFRAPSPTNIPHIFGDGTPGLNNSVNCLLPLNIQGWMNNPTWQPGIPDIVHINGNDRVFDNQHEFPAIMFTGQHIQWNNQGSGTTGDIYLAPSAWMIEVDGECLRPTPEPGVSFALMVGVLLLSVFGRCRRSSHL